MKSDGEIMEIFAAYELAGSFRAAAELAGYSHHTVAKHVAARDAVRPIAERAVRASVLPIRKDVVTGALDLQGCARIRLLIHDDRVAFRIQHNEARGSSCLLVGL